jgi:hypothetical protein
MTKDLVLQSIDHCKRVLPIMERLGIEPDAMIASPRIGIDVETGEEHYLPNPIYTQYIDFGEWKQDRYKILEKLSKDCKDWGIPKYESLVPTYRQDKLELALPEWEEGFDVRYCPVKLSGFKYPLEKEDKTPIMKMNQLLAKVLLKRGQKSLEATVELVCLLKGEGLL